MKVIISLTYYTYATNQYPTSTYLYNLFYFGAVYEMMNRADLTYMYSYPGLDTFDIPNNIPCLIPHEHRMPPGVKV